MKNSIKLLAILFIFCLSCSTDSNNEEDMNDPTDPTPNTTALLKRTVSQDDSGDDYIVNYTYNGNKLVSFNESDTFNATYTYSNDLLVREDAYIGSVQESYTILEYDTNNVLTQYTVYFTGGSNSAIRNEISYLPNNQISTKSYSGDFTTQTVYNYENIDTFSNGNWTKRYFVDYGDEEVYIYDTKNGTFKNMHQGDIFQLLGEPGQGSTNNPTDFDTGETRLEYTYNTNDYPVSSLGYEEGNSVPVISTQYFYE
ncbi:hypothetical protein H2O64_06985 [Kordia sp. YSTF-M3]|uniref:YD repeat-containing protein n=1 Tax=Kordia aestuariivivens TaxID=2759037 RepID=A0ABR7Q786_9FLAO|nr:hypothetical protein [Kordia aestuariivivens]MBC8754410.1 hypothetical protein [Kordia aestuariivivens]